MTKKNNEFSPHEEKQRTLIYYPILHSMEDLGQFKEIVRRASIEKSGLKSVEQKAAAISQLWRNIEKSIQDLSLTGRIVRLYQDGLALCGKEKEIVKDMVKQRSANYLLLSKLMAKGMILMGTESPALLLKEYEAAKRQLKNQRNVLNEAYDQNLLEQRDQFIADRIDQTLNDKETGIVFLGVLHNLEKYLKPDIHLLYPLYHPAGRVQKP